jgi:acetyltransferase-like isoleucine patch superfamily enzyme
MKTISTYWSRFWMRFAGLSTLGRISTRLAAWPAPPHKARIYLANMNPKGYISAESIIYHRKVSFGKNVFLDDRVLVFERSAGEEMVIGNRVAIYRDAILETGYGGSLYIGNNSSIHPRCQINAYISPIYIGSGVMLAPGCALYPYDHSLLPDQPIRKQPLRSKGPIVIEDDVWLGYGTIVLGGVRIGQGAAIGAGSVVTQDIPEGAIAVGMPARVVKMRSELTRDFTTFLSADNSSFRR